MDLDRAPWHVAVSARRHLVLLYPFFIRVANPPLRLFNPVTPQFLIRPLIPLHMAWFFFLVRFYLMPWVLGYTVTGMFSLSLESEFASALNYFVDLLVN